MDGLNYLFGYLIECHNERLEIDMNIFRPALIESLEECKKDNKIIYVSLMHQRIHHIHWYDYLTANADTKLIHVNGLDICSNNMEGY
jgi:hypothetical protein